MVFLVSVFVWLVFGVVCVGGEDLVLSLRWRSGRFLILVSPSARNRSVFWFLDFE